MKKFISTCSALLVAIAFSSAASAGGSDESLYTSPGKPQHPIQVEFDWEGKPQAGKEMQFNVRVDSGMPMSDVRVNVKPSSGLLMNALPEQYLQKVTSGEANQLVYRLTPVHEGRHEMVFTITASHDGRVWTREVTASIPVGDVAVSKPVVEPVGRTHEAADGVREQRVKARQTVKVLD